MKPGDTITVKLKDGTYIKRAEIISMPEFIGVWQFLNMETMNVVELESDEFEILPYSPEMFTNYCECETPKAEPHPNGRDIFCVDCQLTIKI